MRVRARPGATKVHEIHEPGCGAANTHVNVYMAEGSHASYPRRCSPKVFRIPPRLTCRQTAKKKKGPLGIVVTLRLPEGGIDGSKPWPGNYHSASGSVKLFGDWANWNGNWALPGEGIGGHGVKSPGNQPRFKAPGSVTLCTARWADGDNNNVYNCPPGRTESSAMVPGAAGVRSSAAVLATPLLRQAWFGPEVTVTACDADELQAALDAGTVGVSAGSAGLSAGSGQAASAPGLAQSVGDPVTPGQKLELSGTMAPSATLQVRAEGTDGNEIESRFADLGLERGGTLTVAATSSGGAVSLVATRPGGSTMLPVQTNVPTDVPARPVERLTATRDGRLLRITFLPHEDHQSLELVDARGRLVRRAALASPAGTPRTLTLIAPLRATEVRMRDLDDAGQASDVAKARVAG